MFFFFNTFDNNYYDHDSSILLSPIFFFILTVPFATRKNKVLIIFFSICIVIFEPYWRANILRISVCWISVLMYFTFGMQKRLLNMLGVITFIIPLIFLFTGSKNNFAIFDDLSTVTEDKKLNPNTRSFLFIEVFNSIKNKDINLVIGGGASNGYLTNYFSDDSVSLSSKRERYKTEVAFLNTINRSGIIGVILDLLLFFIPAYYAINRSNNNFTKLLGLYMYFASILYFVEMSQSFNLIYFFHFFIVGLCMNNSFRESSDNEIKFFFKSL